MSLSEKARVDARLRAQRDLYFLATEILEWGGDKGGPTVQEDFHRPLCKWIEDVPVRAPGMPLSITKQLLWPRYHGKTTFLDIADNIRWSLIVPDVCIAIGHYKKDDAEQIVKAIRSEYENKKMLKWIAPDVCYGDPSKESPLWNADAFVIKRRHHNKTPSFQAASPEAMPTGMHFDIWNWDDLVTEKNVGTHDQREKMYKAIGYASPYLPPTRLRYIKIAGTRWHIHDAYGKILETARKTGKVSDAGAGERVKSVRLDCLTAGMYRADGTCWMDKHFCVERTDENDPRISRQDLIEEMGSSTFYACMMNNPVAEGTAAFKVEDIKRWNNWSPDGKWEPPVEGRVWRRYSAVDFNIKPDESGDHAVVMTVAKSDRGEMAIIDMDRGHPTQQTIADWIERHVRRWGPERVYVESAGYQETFQQILDERRIKNGIYIPYEMVQKGGRGAITKQGRIMALQGLVEARRLWVPEGRAYDGVVREFEEFSQDGKDQMDDCLDTLADIFKYGGWPTPGTPEPKKLANAPRQAILAMQLLELQDRSMSEVVRLDEMGAITL